MLRVNERDQIRDVAERWAAQYPNNRERPEKEEIKQKLFSLNKDTATAKEVAEIIGNDLWVTPKECQECHVESYKVIQVGQEPDYESYTTYICPDCLRKALLLAESE